MLFERGEWHIDDINYAMLDGESHALRGMLAANWRKRAPAARNETQAREEAQIKDAS
jgi:hypothetical protein